MIDRMVMSFILLMIFLLPTGVFAQPANNMGFMTLPESSSSTPPTPTPSPFNRFTPMYVDSTCFFYGPPGCEDTSGIYYHDRETGKTYKPLAYRNGIPLCHDPLFEMGALGSTCYDEGDPTDPEDYRPIAEECEEVGGYSLSKGSYIENGAIVGSPCDPVGFCSDPNSNDPVVRDHCEDIWTDTDTNECPQGVDDSGECIIDMCPPGSAPIDWCTHLCDEPEYKDDPSCNPTLNPVIPDCPQAGPEVCGEPEIGEEIVGEDDTPPPDDEENEDDHEEESEGEGEQTEELDTPHFG